MKHAFKKGNTPKNKCNIIGQQFGQLTVVSEIAQRASGHVQWLCRCSCSNTTTATTQKLRGHRKQSCGCLVKATMKKRMLIEKPNLRHGMRKTRFYKIWGLIKYRCNNPSCSDFINYGGRGIKCEWGSFEEFKEDMYKTYIEHVRDNGEINTSIDRIDVNTNYSKRNCRWATAQLQQRNRRNNRRVTIRGVTRCVSEWQEIFNLSKSAFGYRAYVKGWSAKKALTTPVKGR